MKKIESVVGLDVSTKIAGWSKIDISSGELIEYGHYEIQETEDIRRAFEMRDIFLPNIPSADKYILEDRLKSFSGGTTANTLFSLAYINASIEIFIAQKYGVDSISKINVATARKKALGVGRLTSKSARELGYYDKGKIDTKMWVYDKITSIYKDIFDEKDFKRTGRPKDYCFDICDSIVLSLSEKITKDYN